MWVPNRNGVFINVAAAFAEGLEADEVVTGFNAEEAVTFPDNTAEFAAAATAALGYSTANGVRVFSYTQALEKREIVRLGRGSGRRFRCVWSCYHGGEEMCRACESCARLERALRAAEAWEWFWEARAAPPQA